MDMNVIGWIVIGFLAGSISGWFVGVRSAQGCLPTIVVGIVGAIIGGWLSSRLGFGSVQGVHRRAHLRDARCGPRAHRAPGDRELIRADATLRRYHRR